MKRARFLITPELLFPDFPQAMRVWQARVTADGCVEFTVEHEDLKEVADVETTPLAEPTFRRDYDTGIVRFIGWGQS